MRPRGAKTGQWQRKRTRRWRMNRRHLATRPAEHQRRVCRRAAAATEGVRDLEYRNAAGTIHSGHADDVGEHVQSPCCVRRIQLVVDQRTNLGQAPRPRVVLEIVHDELRPIDAAPYPRRVAARAGIVNAH